MGLSRVQGLGSRAAYLEFKATAGRHMSYSLNSLKKDNIGDFIEDYYGGY